VIRIAALVLGLLLGITEPATAQQVRVQVPKGPQYVGQPITLRVQAEDFEDNPQPEITVPAPATGRLEFRGVSPSISSSITIINGRVTQMKDVRFVYQYRYLSTQPGMIEIGPFVVTQGTVQRTAPAVRVEIRAVPKSDRLRVVLRIPGKSRYVGQHVPVTVELWLEERLQENMQGYSLGVPLFDLAESFQYLDEPDPQAESNLMMHTSSGALTLPASVRKVVSRDQTFVVVSATRTLVPLRAGDYAPDATTVTVEEGTRWQRDFFGGRRATHVRMWSAADEARSFRVEPVPRHGQPESFAGAVGRGYTLDVTADRTVVQVGDPITLTFTLRGEGNLESAALPALDAEGLLPPEAFRVPDGGIPGRHEEGAKDFTAVVRVLDENVREIPALSYSWFDADRETYETTQSRPIALSVRPAEVIAAEDVFSGSPDEEEVSEETVREAETPRAGSFTLTGADLAIERDPGRLLGSRGAGFGGPWIPVGLYTGASLLVAAALFDRRRRDVDPAVLRRRKTLEGEIRRIRAAARLPASAAVEEVARGLRRMLAEVPHARTSGLDRFLGECDARSYAPEGRSSDSLDEDFQARAIDLARAIAEAGR
jgi:hypothetical protein